MNRLAFESTETEKGLVQFLDVVYTSLCDGINVMKLIHSFYWSNRKLMKFNHFLFLFVSFSPPPIRRQRNPRIAYKTGGRGHTPRLVLVPSITPLLWMEWNFLKIIFKRNYEHVKIEMSEKYEKYMKVWVEKTTSIKYVITGNDGFNNHFISCCFPVLFQISMLDLCLFPQCLFFSYLRYDPILQEHNNRRKWIKIILLNN